MHRGRTFEQERQLREMQQFYGATTPRRDPAYLRGRRSSMVVAHVPTVQPAYSVSRDNSRPASSSSLIDASSESPRQFARSPELLVPCTVLTRSPRDLPARSSSSSVTRAHAAQGEYPHTQDTTVCRTHAPSSPDCLGRTVSRTRPPAQRRDCYGLVLPSRERSKSTDVRAVIERCLWLLEHNKRKQCSAVLRRAVYHQR
eukprot:GEMP01062507.1.p1 GENE.GEMP01062507.1~~GEMP01062507.1.p1  ORF type:complete len:200 (+),score=32.25 GEMP01062507.1:248-847(+)